MNDLSNGAPRVYWLTEGFFPPLVGGQELIAYHLTQGLAQRGAQVQVITRQTIPPSPADEILQGGVRVRRVNPAGMLKGKGFGALLPVLGFMLRLFWILIREVSRYDVIVVSGAKIMPLIVVPLCHLFRKRCVVRAESYFELHETISSESMQTMGARAGRLLFGVLERARNTALRRADAVIAISAQIHQELLARGVSQHRIVPIPNGVSLTKFSPPTAGARSALRERFSIPQDRTVVLFSGRLSRAKGVPLLIEAWPAVFARHPEMYLVIVGSGNRSFDDCESQVKERVAQLGLSDQIAFFPETDAVLDFLQAADAWVFPTEYEGFSLALAEAMGCGLTVIATSVGAAPQMIQHGRNGFLFPPKQLQALIDVLEEAIQVRDQWPSIGSAARKAVAPYDLDLIATRYSDLCRSLVAGRGLPLSA